MTFTPLALSGAFLIEPRVFTDERGSFSEVFRSDRLREVGITTPFVQENESISLRKGTVRGLHCQAPPRAQAKLVRVVSGAILDVLVDARPASATFGRHQAIELSADNGRQLYVPEGFLHGFCTLCDHVRVVYKVSDHYSPAHERAALWSDPTLGIDWPVRPGEALLSAKDAAAPSFSMFMVTMRTAQ